MLEIIGLALGVGEDMVPSGDQGHRYHYMATRLQRHFVFLSRGF